MWLVFTEFIYVRLGLTAEGATTECRATFKHSPNEPARLARQWMKERGIIVCTLSVWFIYLVARLARLARQWIERGIIDMRVRANEPNEPNEPARLVHG